jgi:LPS O-antigen subunit length determinant protein (WzzB/FepE family)
MKKKTSDNDIDLLEVFLTIWHNKMKLVLITIITVVVVMYVTSSPKESKFTIISTTKSISNLDEFDYYNYSFLREQYFLNNTTGFHKLGKDDMIEINKLFLFNLFLKILKEEALAEGIKKFDLVKKENYKDQEAYLSAVEQFKSLIKISMLDNGIEGKIEFITSNKDTKEKWENLLKSLEYSTNRLVQKYLKERLNELKQSVIIIRENQLDYIQEKIENVLTQYKSDTAMRLAFLKEQAQIARKMLELPDYSFWSLLRNVPDTTPQLGGDLYYMRGYPVIEKEIELINKRKDEFSFADGISSLRKQKNEIINNKSFERIYAILEKTPIYFDDKFSAGSIMTGTTELINNAVPIQKRLTMATIIGIIIGIFYVLVINTLILRLRNLIIDKN